jgi:SAM-dependent methyltransferase
MTDEAVRERHSVTLHSICARRPRALRDMLASGRHVCGMVAPAEAPFDRFVAGAGTGTGDAAEGAEVVALRARHAGSSLEWGPPVVMRRPELLRWNFARGAASLDAIRDDPSLLSGLQVGSWFAARWYVRAFRRITLALPAPMQRAVASLAALTPSAGVARLAMDLAFWAGARSACLPPEWEALTRSSYVALCYHRITRDRVPGQERMSLPPKNFRRHLRVLRMLRYRPLSTAEVVAFHSGVTGIGRRRYALTADDGFEDCVAATTAAGVAAQLFVPTAAPGKNAWWTGGGEVADWSLLASAVTCGVEIGSHGRRHRPLVDLSDEQLRDELEGSHADLQTQLPGACGLLAYPNGSYDARVRLAAIDAGYLAAYTTDPGRNGAGLDAFCLHRATPKAWDSRLSFLFRVVTGEPVPARWEARRRRAASRSGLRRRVESRAYRVAQRTSPGRRYRGAIVEHELSRHVRDAGEIKLLDAGSENGVVATTIARRHPEWTVVGVDLNAEALRDGTQWANEIGARNVHFVRADLTSLLRENIFDAAIAVDCLTEVPDDDDALRAIAHSLRPGGVLVVHTPVASWQPVLRGSEHHWPRAVRRGYDPDVLVAKLRAVGLVVDDVRPTLRAVGHLAQEIRDRYVKRRHLLMQLAALPFLVGAVRLEKAGLTVGSNRAMLVVAHRPPI